MRDMRAEAKAAIEDFIEAADDQDVEHQANDILDMISDMGIGLTDLTRRERAGTHPSTTTEDAVSTGENVAEVTLEDGRTGTLNPSWLAESADTVEWRWSSFATAKDPVSQASALVELANAISDLRTFIPGYNTESGDVERPGDEL